MKTITTFVPSASQLVRMNKKEDIRVTSKQVADYFGKRHADVLRAIEDIGKKAPKFTCKNFWLSSLSQKIPCVEMTKEGFTFLALGFTGKKAAWYKIDYIEALNDDAEY